MTETAWTRDLTPDMRERLKDLHKPRPWISVRKIAVLLAIWGTLGATAIAVESWWVRVPCWLVIGLVFHGLGVAMRNLSTTMGHSTGLIREQCPVW